MKNTKQEIEKVVRQIMIDTEREYFENEKIYIELEKDKSIPFTNREIKKCWHISVSVQDEQFDRGEPASILIYINDDNNKIECYLDCSSGRPFPLSVKLNEFGKYELAAIEK